MSTTLAHTMNGLRPSRSASQPPRGCTSDVTMPPNPPRLVSRPSIGMDAPRLSANGCHTTETMLVWMPLKKPEAESMARLFLSQRNQVRRDVLIMMIHYRYEGFFVN